MILFVASDYIPHIGGKSSHILDLSAGLNEINEEAMFFSKSQFSKLKMRLILIILRPFKWINSNLYSYYIAKVWSKILSKKVFKLYKKYSPKCISVQDAVAASSLKKYKKFIKCPIVLTMHTYFGLENGLDIKKNKLTQNVYKKQMKFELRSLSVVDKVIAVDNRIKLHVEQTIKDLNKTDTTVKKVTEIINFTNINKYIPCTLDAKETAKRSFGLSPDKKVICCVRRLVEKNGVIFAVKAMKNLDNKYILLVAGDGPQMSSIKNEIMTNQLNEKVVLLGGSSEEVVKKVYEASDISVVPSITVNGLQEATSITAIESMSCGIPTIASEIGGLKQLISDSQNGLLVPEGDDLAIAEAVKSLSDEERYQSISKNSRKDVVDHYSHLVAAKQYLKEFTSL